MQNEPLFAEFAPSSAEEWKEAISKELKGKSFDAVLWKTNEGLTFNPFYTLEDLKRLEIKNVLPGNYPYSRGNRINNNQWEIRQDIKVANAEQANKKALDLLNKGVTSLGFITENTDVSVLINGILLEHVSVNFVNSEKSPELLERFIAEVKKRKLDPATIKGSVDYDFLGEMLVSGIKADTAGQFDKAASLVNLLSKENLSLFRSLNISGNNYHNAGASIIQELAFSLAHANEYAAQLSERGVAIDDITSSMQFTFSTGSSYLMEIAKLRAARLLWSKIVEQYKPQNTCSMATYIHCITSDWNLSVSDAYNNLLRATTETMSSAIGGANSITVLPFDSAFKDPDDFSERISRNIQIICAEEAHLDKIADPAGGSYYIEKLTDSIAAESWDLFKKIESKGGFLAAVESGFIQDETEKMARVKNEAIAKGKIVLVGVNKFINKDEAVQGAPNFVKPENEYLSSSNIKKLKIYRAAQKCEQEMNGIGVDKKLIE